MVSPFSTERNYVQSASIPLSLVRPGRSVPFVKEQSANTLETLGPLSNFFLDSTDLSIIMLGEGVFDKYLQPSPILKIALTVGMRMSGGDLLAQRLQYMMNGRESPG